MNTDKFEKTVIHLTLKETDEHSYYGSIAHIFDFYTEEELGTKYIRLKNYGLKADHPYENEKIIVRKGKLLTKDRRNNNA